VHKRELTSTSKLLLVVIAVCLLLPTIAVGRVERIEIETQELVADGRSFGLAGAYEKLEGRVFLTLDPEDPGNARVVDLDKAPRRQDGRVEYVADFYILRPIDPRRGNGTALVEVPNRGGKAMVRYFNRGATGSRNPVAAADLGDGFLMRRGFSLVWIGWQHDVPPDPELLRLHPQWATAVESPIEGLVRADEVFAERQLTLSLGHRGHLAYPASDPAGPRNVLTVRDTRLGERRVIPRDQWSFARCDDGEPAPDPRFICLPAGFEPGKIYEAVYVTREPAIVGLGQTALRDFVSYLKHHPESPVAAKRAIGFGVSQTGRFLRQFLYQGFNVDLEGRPAFDGLLVHTAGAGRGSFNHRFGQPSRDAHRFSAFWYPTDVFPFTGTVQKDPDTGLEDGLLALLAGSPAMPRIFFTNSGYEYWGRAASLIHISVDGSRDVPPGPNVRIFHFASAQHFVGSFPPQPRQSLYNTNPANFFFFLRGLLAALDDWVAHGVEPPASAFPSIAAGTLAPPAELSAPKIPGVESPPPPHQAHRVDYGPRFRGQGIVDLQPPRVGSAFPVLVPQVDGDGNEVGGLRLPEIAVPLATYTPWNLRPPEIGAPDEMADFVGAFLPFPRTRAEREASGDPRLSLEERYASRSEYLGRYTEAAIELVSRRYLLAEDLPEMVEHAQRLWDHVH
jgi:hypothetical protein